MSNDVEDHFLDVLELLAPDMDIAAYPSIVSAISDRMLAETNAKKVQSLNVLLGLELGKPLGLYRCVSDEFVDVATEQQALMSARLYQSNGVIKIRKRQYYVA
jgi:hypothetical protein